MKKTALISSLIFTLFLVVNPFLSAFAVGPEFGKYPLLEEAQQYDRAIHIMAMLLVGFGFLMVFLKKYGRSALTATFLLVSVAIPMYFFFTEFEPLARSKGDIEKLILSEFGAASLLIAAGALLGRIKMHQYIVLGLLFIPFYMINEWIILENGIGVMPGAIADIANAALAGGVAIGATCDHASHGMALVIGVLAGAISTVGFAVIQSKQQKILKAVDTCGVSNLHGLPGIFGGLIAIPLVQGISTGGQLMGIGITISIAIISGLFSGKIISLFGSKQLSYIDAEEFLDTEEV